MNRLGERYGEVADVIQIMDMSVDLAKDTGSTPINDHLIQCRYLAFNIKGAIATILEKESSSNHTEFICILSINTVLLRATRTIDFGMNRFLEFIKVPTGEEGIG